jgi:hypothetical protein
MMNEKVSQKQLENRLKRLNDQPEIPYTPEEELYLRVQKLSVGGKTKKYKKSNKKRGKTNKKHGKSNKNRGKKYRK